MARSFASANSEYLINGSSAPVANTPVSISCWFNPATTANGSLVSIAHATSSHRIGLLVDSAGKLVFGCADSTSATATSAASYSTGVWNHGGATVNSDNYNRSVYLNGTATAGGTAFAAPASLSRMLLGAYGYNGGQLAGWYFNGELAEVGIWNVELSAQEMQALAAGASPLSVRPTALVAYYPLLGRSADEPDFVGGITLTDTNTVSTSSNHPPMAFGQTARLIPAPAATAGTTYTYTPSGGISIAGSAITSFTAGGSAITVTDYVDRRVFQRSGTTANIVVSGTYTGTAPTSVQARVVLDSDGTTEVVAWTTLTGATIAGGTFSGTLASVPQDDVWYNIQVRYGNDTGITSSGTNRWGVGSLYAIIGQSNARLFCNVAVAGSPHASTVKYSGSAGTGWVDNTGAGSTTFANAMRSAQGVVVGILSYGLDGTALLQEADVVGYWLNTASNSPYDQFIDGVDSIGGKIEAAYWNQGEAEINHGSSQANYYAGLGTLFGRIRSHFGQSTLPIFIAPNASRYSTDGATQSIRDAQIQATGDSYNYLACTTYDADSDGTHYTNTGQTTIGTRLALRVQEYLGLISYGQGPYIASAARVDNNTLDVTVTLRGGTTIAPASGITGFQVIIDGTPETITSGTRQSATVIRLTTSASMAGASTLAVRYMYGTTPTTSGKAYDDSSNALPLIVTNSVGVAVSVSYEYAPSGGLTLGGSATYSFSLAGTTSYAYTPSGGLSFAGAANTSYTSGAVPSGIWTPVAAASTTWTNA